jgi:hypothetical protein
VQKLHLVGFTTDQKGLILSARRGARSGSFHLPVDQPLAEAVDELRARQAEEEAERIEVAESARPARVESALSVKEIQARLRQGRSVADVAKVAGVDTAWVDRFATPILAERAQVISRVQLLSLRRARLGPSEHPIAESIRRNLSDRGVAVSPEEFADGWTARQLADGRWAVRFRFRQRPPARRSRPSLPPRSGPRSPSGFDRTMPPASPSRAPRESASERTKRCARPR